jgi:hypothetical protein
MEEDRRARTFADVLGYGQRHEPPEEIGIHPHAQFGGSGDGGLEGVPGRRAPYPPVMLAGTLCKRSNRINLSHTCLEELWRLRVPVPPHQHHRTAQPPHGFGVYYKLIYARWPSLPTRPFLLIPS